MTLRTFQITFVASLVALQWMGGAIVLRGQGSAADYERSETYSPRTAELVFRDKVVPQWIPDETNAFWYRVQIAPKRHQYVLVDCISGSRSPAFDHESLADKLSAVTGVAIEAHAMDLRDLRFDLPNQSCEFRFASDRWNYSSKTGVLQKVEKTDETQRSFAEIEPQKTIQRSTNGGDLAPIRFENRLAEELQLFWIPASGSRVSYGKVAASGNFQIDSYAGHAWVLETTTGTPKAAFVVDKDNILAVIDSETTPPAPAAGRRDRPRGRDSSGGISPDGAWQVTLDSDNVQLLNRLSGLQAFQTADGHEQKGYQGRVWWSPDSQHFVVMKTAKAEMRRISMIESAPDNSLHSRVLSIDYAKPGDEIDHPRPVLFHVVDPEPILIDDALFHSPYSLRDVHWNESSESFSFVYNQRGHQVLRVISVDAKTAVARTVVEETPDTFVCYSSKSYQNHVNDNELIWMSERSGWNHLWIIDKQLGTVKNAITQGDWVVRDVIKVDNADRVIWLAVSGIDADQDPYYQHLIRVGFDGNNLVRLTEGDGDHQWEFSPDGKFLIDTFSRVDMPPRTVLRNATNGRFVCELERADESRLTGTGWRHPERFVAKARDGKTDIYGIIVRPTNFDATKRYPVLEAIYAGPHSSFVPKKFGRHTELYEMAELGFIVVKIDGMGTSHRSKAFHDVCWQNLGDSGFPDRIAWMKAAAEQRPEMDLERIGIWGGSAGGQSAMRALIAHGDFYRAAVADCGCHDNRVDKIWWNEQWMGWPIGPHYADQSNVTQAHRLQGDLMLIWGELDQNVDPASTMQVIDALIKADKDFEQLIMPGVGHGAAGQRYAKRRQADFFVRKLWNVEPRHP